MGALAQHASSNAARKGAGLETKVSRRDEWGRDPESASEQLRRQSDYERDSGYAPFFHAWMADLPRLAGQSSVIYAIVLTVLRLSLGRPVAGKGGRNEWTEPITAAQLAELCRCSQRDAERQIAELSERGVIKARSAGRGKHLLSLAYRDWQGLEDYAVWKRRQAVAIDSAAEIKDSETDEAIQPVTKGAVKLTRSPATVRPGRASRAVKVAVGVRELALHNESSTVDIVFSAVVDSGRLVVSANAPSVPKGEDRANAQRHYSRSIPSNGGILQKHTRYSEIVSLFDPLLQKSGARLIGPDVVSANRAAEELGAMPHDYLVHWLMSGRKARGSRPIQSPAVVAHIVREARLNWESVQTQEARRVHDASAQAEKRRKNLTEFYLATLSDPRATEDEKAAASECLAKLDDC